MLPRDGVRVRQGEGGMELRQLQYFLSIADSTSLSRASSVLGVAQPALSRQLRQLEQELGVSLFYRHGRGIQLTEEGERFRVTIAPLIRDLLDAKASITEASSAPAGPLSCAMPPSISAVIGARLVKTFLERFPNVMLHLTDAFSGYVNELLVDGRVDVAVVVGARRSPQIRADPLLQVDLFYVTTRNRVPAKRRTDETVPFQEVAAGRLILPGRHHGLRRELEAAAAEQGLKLDVFVEIDALSAMKELVRSDVGPTILPQGAILSEFDDPQLIIRRIVDPPLVHQFMVAYARYRPPTLATAALGRALRDEIRLAIADGRLIGRV